MDTEYYVYKSGNILITKGWAYIVSETRDAITIAKFTAGETWRRRIEESEMFLYIAESKSDADYFVNRIRSNKCKRVYSRKRDKSKQSEADEYDLDYNTDYVW